jgi:cytochrome c oxidase cbb3-type subunit IV
MDYHFLRHFADSWGLLFLTLVFVGIAVWTLRPGAKYDSQSSIPFRNDDE